MVCSNGFCRKQLSALLVSGLLVTPVLAQLPSGPFAARARGKRSPAGGAANPAPARPSYRLAERTTPAVKPFETHMKSGQPNEHPLMPALRWAYDGIGNIEKIEDYSATLVKREQVNGKVGEYQYLFVKIRHDPFSVYVYFAGPPALRGREVIFIKDQNDGKMWAHGTGMQETVFGTVSLHPTGMIAMRGQRYPLTEIGVLNLVRRLIEVGEKDLKYGECEVKFFEGAKINNRVCTCIQVVHPVPRRNFLFHLARIFVDDELNVPIRYEAYDWPKKPGGPPQLIEEYTYLNFKFNNGFTDADFDIRNPNYNFR